MLNKRIFVAENGCYRFIGRTIMDELFETIGNIRSIDLKLPVGSAKIAGNGFYGPCNNY